MPRNCLSGYGWARGSISKREDREGVSTVAGRAGGPVRSSDEGPVMGLERRGRVVRGCVRSINRMSFREESRGRVESIWQVV